MCTVSFLPYVPSHGELTGSHFLSTYTFKFKYIDTLHIQRHGKLDTSVIVKPHMQLKLKFAGGKYIQQDSFGISSPQIGHFSFVIMTGEQQFPHPQDVNPLPQDLTNTKYFRAINNKNGVRKDMEAMCKFVRETLFYALIHDARGAGTNPDDEVLKEEGKACNSFVKAFKTVKDKITNTEITNTELIGASTAEQEHYLKYLWKEGLKTKKAKYNIRRAFSSEKSAVYAGISESFKRTSL